MQLEIISNMLKKVLCSDKKYQRSTVINGDQRSMISDTLAKIDLRCNFIKNDFDQNGPPCRIMRHQIKTAVPN